MSNRIRLSLLEEDVVPSTEGTAVRAGSFQEFTSLAGALDFLDALPTDGGFGKFRNYEVLIELSNGDNMKASFRAKEKAREFLRFMAT